MAHLRDIPRPTCFRCGKPAKVELYNRYNSCLGAYCIRCGQRAWKTMQADEQRTAEQRRRQLERDGEPPF